jgi:hypothetical protein
LRAVFRPIGLLASAIGADHSVQFTTLFRYN